MSITAKKNVRVLYDHQIFSSQKYGGISRYFYELAKDDLIPNYISIFYSDNHYYIKPLFNKLIINNIFIRYILIKINKIHSIYNIRFKKYDIFHPTYFDSYFLKHIKKPFVVTIYDMIHEKFPEYFGHSNFLIKNKRQIALKASKIITISESTKKDIINIYGIDPEKITVIYLASSFNSNNLTTSTLIKINFPFILFVGKRGLYKNFDNFIAAFSKVSKIHTEYKVVCVGGGKLLDSEKRYLVELGLLDKVIQITASEEEIWGYYTKSKMFIFPSEYEGFGLPILEAFSAKTPCLLSNRSSFPEIAKDAALYFNPKDQESIAREITKLIKSNSLRNKLIEEGTKRLQEFDWKKTIAKTKDIYLKVTNMERVN